MQRTSCWGMSLPCLSRRLVWRCGCFQLLYSGFAHFVFEKKKEEEITAGGLYPWTIPIAITMAACARNCSCCRRQRMHSSTGSTPFAVWGKPISHHGISRDAFIGDDGGVAKRCSLSDAVIGDDEGVANRCPFSGGRRLLRDMMGQSPRYSHCGLLPNSIGAATAD